MSGSNKLKRDSLIYVYLSVVFLVISSLITSCGSDGPVTSTSTATQVSSTSPSEASTTSPPLASISPESIPGSTSPSISPEVAESMRVEIGALILDAEESRGLPFLEIPAVTILDTADFTERIHSLISKELDPIEVAFDQTIFELLGMLDGETDLYQLFIDLYTEQVAGFYDPEVGELVVPVSTDGITPLQEITIIHELVHALTDQHFDFNDIYEELLDVGTGDDTYGILALVEGDATYQQFLHLESMDPSDATDASLEAYSIETTVFDNAPEWVQLDLTFPYEYGFIFTGFLMESGGLKGVDEAYQKLPVSSEQILHPEKYLRFESPSELQPLDVVLEGWEIVDEATLGEWGIRLLLLDSLRPGEVTQAAAGWGNDTYRAFVDDDDAAIVWVYDGETIMDAEDLTDGLIAHVYKSMDAGSPRESGGGLLFDGGTRYVFIDRVDEMIYLVISTDQSAGESLREQLGL